MFKNPIEALRALSPRPDHTISHHDTLLWDDGVLDGLLRPGFLIESTQAELVACPACHGEHRERVMRVSANQARIVITCPDAGIVALQPEHLRQYAVDHNVLVRWAATQLGAKSEPEEPIRGEIWRWDHVHLHGGRDHRTLIIARHLPSRTPQETWDRMGLVPKALVLTLGPKPSSVPADSEGILFVPLWTFVDFDQGAWSFSRDGLAAMSEEKDRSRGKSVKPKASTRASRMQDIEAVHQALIEYICSAKDALRNRSSFTRLEQKVLAKLAGVSTSKLNRILHKDTSPQARKVKVLFAIANTEDEIRSFDKRQYQ